MQYQDIIDYYFPESENKDLRHTLLTHSEQVAEKAKAVCLAHPELHADANLVYAAAMLHDIGIMRCDAAGIYCFGTEPYIKHGILGAAMLNEYKQIHAIREDLTAYERVCARHTGTGLTAENIIKNNLPLPHQDLTPETTEEKIICYADKFFSKTKLGQEKTFKQALKSLEKFGAEGLEIFIQWHEMFKEK